MEYQNLERLEVLRRRNASSSTWINSDLYRLLFKPDLYIVAYEKIKSKPGNMTPGVDGSTLDGFSLERIEKIIAQMRDESFQFLRARKVYISKSNGGKRPLGIIPPKDKVIQECIRMILECIYDSPYGATFKETSHGFRSDRGTHTALKVVRQWDGTNWIIEGDIKGCFDNIDHEVLISLLRKRIRDERFLNLVRKALTAGYLEFNTSVNSIVGSPQGSILSAILANIYLHELDKFVENLVRKYDHGKARKPNPAYRTIQRQRLRLKTKLSESVDATERAELFQRVRELEKETLAVPSLDPNDSDFIRIKYVRYADDWVISVIGPKTTAKTIRDEVSNFLSENLKLTLSLEKAYIRHAKTEMAFFLGTRFKFGDKAPRVVRIKTSDGRSYRRRTTGWNSRMYAPTDLLVQRLHQKGFCDVHGVPTAKSNWAILDNDQIIGRFNSVLWSLLNYYNFVDNYGGLSRIQYILKFSAAKTLSNKHKQSMRKTFRRYGDNLTVRKTLPNGSVRKTQLRLQRKWKSNPNGFLTKVQGGPKDFLNVVNGIRSRSKLGCACVICGRLDGVEMHHIRHVRKMGHAVKGFSQLMAIINRKQIPVCQECHHGIHRGTYDGMRLGDLALPDIASA